MLGGVMNHQVVKNIITIVLSLAMFPAFIMIVGPEFPATEESLMRSDSAASTAAGSLSKALRGNTVRVDRRFGDNLNLYLHRKAFEQVPDGTRDTVIKKVGESWCAHASLPWLPRVALYDIESGTRIATHHCVLSDLGEVLRGSLWN